MSITWGDLYTYARSAKPLHDAYYIGCDGRTVSGLRHLRLARWAPIEGAGHMLVLAQEWLAQHIPTRYAEASELLSLLDWSQPLVAFVEVEAPDGAAFICPSDDAIAWESDKLGRKPIVPLALGLPDGIRHLQHRLAAIETEWSREPAGEPEPWYPKWSKRGGSGEACFIAWQADGTPVERSAWDAVDAEAAADSA